MLSIVIISLTAFAASILTFFSGFGLGTLLAPVMMLFFPPEVAIAMTGIVHLLNNLLKLGLTGINADRNVVITFGIPAVLSALVGSWLLIQISELPVLYSYKLYSSIIEITWVKFIIGILLMVFAMIELIPYFENLQFNKKFIPIGGILSGFFGGLTGTQGALRSAFLIRSGLTKTAFIGTTAVISTIVDITRIGMYAKGMTTKINTDNTNVLIVAIVAAAIGALLGNKLIQKVTINFLKKSVAFLLFVIAIGLISGVL